MGLSIVVLATVSAYVFIGVVCVTISMIASVWSGVRAERQAMSVARGQKLEG